MTEKANCEICGKDIIVQMCCDGYQCGCMGLPIEPLICNNDRCWHSHMSKNFNNGKD